MKFTIVRDRPPAYAGRHTALPLPFDPAKLHGLSAGLLEAHWASNYCGAVKALNDTEARLAAAMDDPEFSPPVYGGLKREEALRAGSIRLHELYFANLGGDGRLSDASAIAIVLARAFGSIGAWRAEFVRVALSLSGGSGWCVLSCDSRDGVLRNHWAWDHMHGAIGCIPLLVVDMYEHAYQVDFGTRTADYIDTFLGNVKWEEVDRRYALARARGPK